MGGDRSMPRDGEITLTPASSRLILSPKGGCSLGSPPGLSPTGAVTMVVARPLNLFDRIGDHA